MHRLSKTSDVHTWHSDTMNRNQLISDYCPRVGSEQRCMQCPCGSGMDTKRSILMTWFSFHRHQLHQYGGYRLRDNGYRLHEYCKHPVELREHKCRDCTTASAGKGNRPTPRLSWRFVTAQSRLGAISTGVHLHGCRLAASVHTALVCSSTVFAAV